MWPNTNKDILSRSVPSLENNPNSIDVIALVLLSSHIIFHIHIKGLQPSYCLTYKHGSGYGINTLTHGALVADCAVLVVNVFTFTFVATGEAPWWSWTSLRPSHRSLRRLRSSYNSSDTLGCVHRLEQPCTGGGIGFASQA